MDFIAAAPVACAPAVQPVNIQLQFEHHQTEISIPDHIGV
jgi:hypothetical protein